MIKVTEHNTGIFRTDRILLLHFKVYLLKLNCCYSNTNVEHRISSRNLEKNKTVELEVSNSKVTLHSKR
mgnify:CR=1